MNKEYKLYNRYRVPVSLVETDKENVWTLELPEEELNWVQVSYDMETRKNEDGLEEQIEVDYSVDPSGGPYMQLGQNRLNLYPFGEIEFNLKGIRYDKDVKRYFLEITDMREIEYNNKENSEEL